MHQVSESRGVAYFHDDTLFVGECAAGDEGMLHMVASRFPGCTLVAAPPLVDALRSDIKTRGVSCKVVSLARQEFMYQEAVRRLLTIQIADMLPSSELKTESAQELHLRSALDLDSVVKVQVLGGLLGFLMRNQLVGDMDSSKIVVQSIQSIPGNLALEIDGQSLQALSIFASEYHPYSSNVSRKKEGLSVFGLLNHTRTNRGKLILKSWMNFPTRDMAILKYRMNHVEFFSHPQFHGLVQGLQNELRGVKDTRRLLNRIYTVQAKVLDWKCLFETLQSIALIHSTATTLPDVPALSRITEAMSDSVGWVARTIEQTIDFNESHIAQRVCVQPGVDKSLDFLKQQYANLDTLLDKVASDDIKSGTLPSCIHEMCIVYIPQLGYLVKVPHTQGTTPSLSSGALGDFSYRWKADGYVYYKNTRTQQLDNELGDIQGIIADKESAIVRQLAQDVLSHAESIKRVSNAVYELDSLVSLAVAAVKNNLVRPVMTRDRILDIQEGRHVLQEVCSEAFIPNDASLSESSGRVRLITGPNASGKSVFLKQVGLIAFLAHVGSFVPAKKATVGLVDKIFTRIDASSSVLSTLSTFSRDASQVSRMLNKCTSSSLLLIDEFGKGTNAIDGCALLASIVLNLEKLKDKCPHTIVVTHYHEIFAQNLVKESQIVKFYQMDCVRESVKTGAPAKDAFDNIVFLYKLKPGVCFHSRATMCARRLGVPQKVLERAMELTHNFAASKEIRPIQRTDSRPLLVEKRTTLRLFKEVLFYQSCNRTALKSS